MNRSGRLRAATTAVLAVGVLAGCDKVLPPKLVLPTDDEAAAFYAHHSGVERVTVNGTIVEVIVRQPESQLERGGPIWAKVGPYVHLFSPDTEALFQQYNGAAAVRVTTVTSQDRQVARVMLRRDALSDILWRRSQNILGNALQSGTERPRLLEELVEWGERYAEYEYNPEFVSR